MKVEYAYLKTQFQPDSSLSKAILEDIRRELYECQFTLGPWVARFEVAFAKAVGAKHAVGVSSGTAALFLGLKAMEIGLGDEVITIPNTFVATIGAILQAGAKAVFVDVGADYLINQQQAKQAVNERTKAVLPVDLTGNPVPIGRALQGVHRAVYTLRDACQSVGATLNGQAMGGLCVATAYSLHPLKNVNCWGDGGVVTTDNDTIAERIRLMRNHGLQDRDTVAMPGYNERLSSLQAIVAFHALKELPEVTSLRRQNAQWYDEALRGVPGIIVPPREPNQMQVFHTYVIQVENREELQRYLQEHEIETKVHYPIPLHLQPGFACLGYHVGDFPESERQAAYILSLPVHQYLAPQQQNVVIDTIRAFYKGKR